MFIELTDIKLGQGAVGFVFKGYVFPRTRTRFKQKVFAAVKVNKCPYRAIALQISNNKHFWSGHLIALEYGSKISKTCKAFQRFFFFTKDDSFPTVHISPNFIRNFLKSWRGNSSNTQDGNSCMLDKSSLQFTHLVQHFCAIFLPFSFIPLKVGN